MNNFKSSSWLSVAATLGLISSAFVAGPVMAEDHAEEHHVPESHVHGLASLFIVQEDRKLLLELESPAMNLVGFEHAPHNDAQHEHVEKTERQLAAGDKLFSFSGGQCQLLEADIEMAALEGDHEEEEDHEAEHDGHHEAAHEEHEEHEGSEAEHSDVEAKYLFNCQQPATLKAIDVTLFDVFPGVEELDAQWVVRSLQGGRTLSPESSRIELQ